ncbi:MAG TPA: phenylalanine--tRNA ligase beta subunit-related protein [Streptosporangiaceae bacterium]
MSADPRAWLASAHIDDAVTALRPDYAALLIVGDGLTPGPTDDVTDGLLRAAEEAAVAALGGRPPADLAPVADWRAAYRSFGARPSRTRPSVEALLRRVAGGLPRIDRITDVYNAVSVRRLIPVGGEDLARYQGPARLVRAVGDEPFDTVRDGEPVLEHPERGEVIWRDNAGVTCRCWNWRQCVRTRITHATVTAVFVLDGLAALDPAGLLTAAQDLTETLAAVHPGARFTSRLLSS